MCCLILSYCYNIVWYCIAIRCKLWWKCFVFITTPIRFLWRYVPNVCMYPIGFVGGYALGQLYYQYLLTQIPFPCYLQSVVSIGIGLLMGLANAACRQMRCISMLTFPMYCGKPGRSVLKAVVLTYVIAGPITNMGLNAKEVVRVYACSTELSQNLSRLSYRAMSKPLKESGFVLKDDMEQLKDTLTSLQEVADPIENEMEDMGEIAPSREFNDCVDDMFLNDLRSEAIEKKYAIAPNDSESQIYHKNYLKKLEYRCNDQLSLAVRVCTEAFKGVYERCAAVVPKYAIEPLCWPLQIKFICNVVPVIGSGNACDSSLQVNPGLGEGYAYLKKAKRAMSNFKLVKLQYQVNEARQLYEFQDATETGALVMHDFEEKHIIMEKVIMAVHICVALLFFRIMIAAATYHDTYLTSIGYDNVYITGYFKKIDKRRRKRREPNLLPLKKMERSKYVDIHSTQYTAERNKLFNQILKVLLEMVTATTFVMLDRLFFEALDVVALHAEQERMPHQEHTIQVEGEGILANLVRTVLAGLNQTAIKPAVSNKACLPHPRSMPPIFFLKIYGGYLWILLLLYINPYTVRLRRLICSWFYPKREKQRILHLYNDILKKRLKMEKTLRRKAVQSVRAYYLSGENLLSLRLKFPRLLGWLSLFPAARKTCLICGETEPKSRRFIFIGPDTWHNCSSSKCPFVYCDECWREIDQRCLACDPSLAELSDVDSLSDDEQPRY